MKSKFSYFSLLYLVCLLNAQYSGDEVIWKAVRSFYNYDTGKAISILNNARIESTTAHDLELGGQNVISFKCGTQTGGYNQSHYTQSPAHRRSPT